MLQTARHEEKTHSNNDTSKEPPAAEIRQLAVSIAGTRPPKDRGHAAFFFWGFYDSAGEDEKGPTYNVSQPWDRLSTLVWSSLKLAAGTKETVIGLCGDGQGGRVLSVCPKKPLDVEIFCTALDLAKVTENPLTLKQFALAHKKTIWVETELQGLLFLDGLAMQVFSL